MSQKKKTEKVARAKEEEGRHTSNKERISMVKWMLMNPSLKRRGRIKENLKKFLIQLRLAQYLEKLGP